MKATVEITATPIAPPTCCDVFSRPEARPASSGRTPASAAIVIGMNENGMPIADREEARQQIGRIAAVDGDLRVPESAGARAGEPVTGTGFAPNLVDERLRRPGHDDGRAGGSEERDARLQHGEAQDLLHVERQQEEGPVHPPASRNPATFAAVTSRLRKIPSGISGAGSRHSQTTKKSSSEPGEDDQADRPEGRPAHVRRLRDRVDEQRQARVTLSAPSRSYSWTASSARLSRTKTGVRMSTSDPDRDVDEEDPLPAEVLREDAAEQDARGGAAAADRAPRAERLVPLGCPP